MNGFLARYTPSGRDEALGDDHEPEDVDHIAFFRSPMDGEWYVRMGHETSGACDFISAIYKVTNGDWLDVLHDESEQVTVWEPLLGGEA